MSTVGGGVNIIKDGLVMYLDASNTKSLADVPATNILLNSNAFENASWSTLNISVTANQAVSPSGLQDADLVDDGVVTNTQHWLYQNPTFLYNTTYTLSVFAKYISRKYMTINIYNGVTSQYVDYDILNGVVYGTTGDVTASIQSYGNSWYRLSYTRTIAATGSPNFRIAMADDFASESYTGSNKQVYLYGAQFELGSVATTYIPTTSVAASRVPTWTDISKGGNNGTLTSGFTYNYSNGGSLLFNGVNNIVNIGPGTNYAYPYHTYDIWVKTPGLGLSMSQCGLIAFDYGRYVTIDSTGNLRYTINWNGVTDVLFNAVTATNSLYDNKWHNVVCSRGTSLYTISIDGNLVVSGSNGGQPTWNGLNIWSSLTSRIGSNPNNNTYFLNGNISLVKVYNRQLSASEVLQNYNATKTRFGL